MILIFGGTTEGRAAVEVLDAAGQLYYYSTRSAKQQVECKHGERLTGGMDEEEMSAFCRDRGIRLIVDAAHPFAVQLHANIARVSERLDLPVIRYERVYPPRSRKWVWCDSFDDAIRRLEERGIGSLLALSGLQTIPRLRAWWTCHPTWFRVLDREESRALAVQYGFPEERLLYFHEGEDEEALFSSLQPDAILTKESGESGFFEAKVEAAERLGIPVFVVKRPALSDSFYVVTGKNGLRHRVERLLPGFFPLKSGYTTGTCACAAAKAALSELLDMSCGGRVNVALPCGEEVELPVAWVRHGGMEDLPLSDMVGAESEVMTACVVKDAGDDPDVTDGSRICVSVRLTASPGVCFRAGSGVGTVTLPGLGLAVGEPAINPVPRAMIVRELKALLHTAGQSGGVEVTVSVPGGETLALKTFNPKLGITGGISIIGTSGVVRPFSSEAFVATIRKEIQVAHALGCNHIVINSGAKSERMLRGRFPGLQPQAFIHYGNYIGDTLRIASEEGMERVTMGIMIGKAVKLAEGHTDTHSRNIVMNRDFIVALMRESGCSEAQSDAVEEISLARELWTLLPAGHPFFDLLVRKCLEVCAPLAAPAHLEILLLPEQE